VATLPLPTEPQKHEDVNETNEVPATPIIVDVDGNETTEEESRKIENPTNTPTLPDYGIENPLAIHEDSINELPHQQLQQQYRSIRILINRDELLLQLLSDEISGAKNCWLCGRIETGTRKLIDMVLETEQPLQVITQ